MKVYLAGPITGLTYDEAQDWRAGAQRELDAHGIQAYSPLRGKDYLRAVGRISGTGKEYQHMGALSTPRGVTTRDRFDATNCDILLVNLLGATRVSIGTVMEIAWADLCRKQTVVVMEDQGNPHEHMMLEQCTGYRVTNIEDALHIVKAIAGHNIAAWG
jgi:nucleoside 2-deoxyribosyltransferase